MTPKRQDRQPPWSAWILWLALLAGIALWCRPAMPVDETRYLSVAWEMWLRGDFLVPFKNGEPYSHKPPLLFWLIHLGWWLAGVSDWWPRLISPLLSLACAGLTWKLARCLWPEHPATARLAPLVLISSLLWLLYSEALFFDILISLCALLGLLGLVQAARTGELRWWGLFALAIGLGGLAKGPAILVHLLPAALLAPWWRQPRWPQIHWPGWYARLGMALVLGVALTLAWAIPAGQAGGEAYRNAIFWGQTADRVVQSFAHRRPAWWYLACLPLFLFPWLFWPRLLARLIRGLRSDWRDPGQRFVLVWFLGGLLIFSAISGKQPHYLLPEMPAAALILGYILARRPLATTPWLPGLALILLGLGMGYLALAPLDFQDAELLAKYLPPWAGAGFIGAGLLALAPAPDPEARVRRMAGTSLMAVLWLLIAVIRPFSAAYDVGPMARELARQEAMGRPIAIAGRYHAQFQFAGRLKAPLATVPEAQLPDWLRAHPDGVAVLTLTGEENAAPYQPLFTSPYRSGRLILVDRRAGAALAAHAPSGSGGDGED